MGKIMGKKVFKYDQEKLYPQGTFTIIGSDREADAWTEDAFEEFVVELIEFLDDKEFAVDFIKYSLDIEDDEEDPTTLMEVTT